MKFTVTREALLRPLQLVAGVVERRQTMAVLSNILVVLDGNRLSLTGTDTEVEIVGRIELDQDYGQAEITVPAKKLVDICRSLPDGAVIDFSEENQRVLVKSGRSRFQLSTLPASDFPATEESEEDIRFSVSQGSIKRIIDRTSFAMAQQDVRYYLNGMLWELTSGKLRVVATDGHRLALCDLDDLPVQVSEKSQSILPRKGVIELARLLEDSDEVIEVALGKSQIRANTEAFTFTSKLVDGKFPDYERVLPKGGDKTVIGSRNELKQAFSRTAILSNEKYRGVRMLFEESWVTLLANNPEQEEAEEQVAVDYAGETLEIGFNVSYLQDVANVLSSEQIKFTLSDSNSSALLEEAEGGDSLYVVMPMRL
ncbi:DNA polymerase III subunit beta [Marinibactrum halimedae]|uniref:Beta sliding clamp n=1 Tax=Marinibactrum halimedae TaxID=1444977 RepID=A0AA37TFQ7_9GAMM|nr:DNA polymerase III subunit beta [Marinibactrum halimedae]MCD9460020.1 DNA polymerase III subunit beta [Marinibactrum halimedae]GLS28212.1 DNA polymerase III subunit beta [Marinibactrum halimedae]